MSRVSAAIVLWTVLFIWAAAILWLSSLTPQDLPPAAFFVSDKLNHFLAFAVGGWLAAGALRASGPRLRPGHVVLAAVILVAAFGALDEALQKFTPGRTGGDLYDWIADFLGASAGALFSRYTHGFPFRFRPRP